MAACTNHPTTEAVQTCPSCARPFCNDCLVEFQGYRYCGACKNDRVRGLQTVTEYKLPGEALTYAIVGIICFGIILEPIAIFKAIKALGEIKANPSLPGKNKAVAALCIAIGLFLLNILYLAFVLTVKR